MDNLKNRPSGLGIIIYVLKEVVGRRETSFPVHLHFPNFLCQLMLRSGKISDDEKGIVELFIQHQILRNTVNGFLRRKVKISQLRLIK